MKHTLKEDIDAFDPHRKIEIARTPPGGWYFSQELFELEKKAVFNNSWQIVARVSELENPGDFLAGNFLSNPYLLVRDEAGVLRGYHNVCPHHGGWLAPDSLDCSQLVCSYHGWRFSLEGELLKTPSAGAIAALRDSKPSLKPIKVCTWGPFILISFSTSIPPFEGIEHEAEYDELSFASLRYLKSQRYKISCNWKVFVDNYLDGGYHVSVLHPQLAKHLDLGSYQSRLFSNSAVQSCLASSSQETKDHRARERLGKGTYYGWFYPNTMINRYGKWLDLNRVIPTGAKSCEVIFDYFYEGDARDEELEAELNDSDQVQQEDVLISERVQVSMESGIFEQGYYAPNFEAPMFHFHKLLHQDYIKEMDLR